LLDYYTALARYEQLKYLEQSQQWEEYFNSGNAYREEALKAVRESVKHTDSKSIINVYARLLFWRLHQELQDDLGDAALADLLSSLFSYARDTKDPLPIKDVADQLMAAGQRPKAKELYRLYVDRLVAADMKEAELKAIADSFYQQKNAELSQAVYDIYIKKISAYPKEKAIPELIEIARRYSVDSLQIKDPLYAEGVFRKIEQKSGRAGLGEELTQLRALNLEKAKDYVKAREIYLGLLKDYPGASFSQEVTFKLGLLETYIFRNPDTGRAYFLRLAQDDKDSPDKPAAVYQLGLLEQWENKSAEARNYYQKAISLAEKTNAEILALARLRLKELDESKPLEYNLKTFLDVSLKEEYKALVVKNLELTAQPPLAKPNEEITISAGIYKADTGCLQVDYQYLWSGDTGTTLPAAAEGSSFKTSYLSSGSKQINLVVVSSSGIIDRSLELVDIR
jgi:tetratricopeptide (TPR) repeat protein